MPNAVLEAMAAARPVAAARVGGAPELVVSGQGLKPLDGETGVLVRPEAVEELAEAVIALLKDPARRERMGRAGRDRVESRFSLAVMVERYAKLYDSLAPAEK
jgi:glycosyltransferase involved in cell wall biosynthesis